jgi:hypothetical protein
MIIPNALSSLPHPDFNYGELATVISILETTAINDKANNTHYYSMAAIRE